MMLLSIGTLLVALYIPRKIMVDQTFSSLVMQYRSPEMGLAILSISNFYVNECKNTPDLIEEVYIYNTDFGRKQPFFKLESNNLKEKYTNIRSLEFIDCLGKIV
jgi:hypothetical protein